MKNGVDPHELAQRYAKGSRDERRRLTGDYAAWIKQGARVGAWWTVAGILLIAFALFSPMWVADFGLPSSAYAVAVVAAVVGVLMFRRGARKEKEWRTANPFRS